MGYTVSWSQRPFTKYTYSNIIQLIPKVIDSKLRTYDWGFSVGPSVDECIAIEKDPTNMTFVKTNRDPYTKDVMKTLILMVEFGAAEDLCHDDDHMTLYLDALDEVHSKYPLVSYDAQKEYFNFNNL